MKLAILDHIISLAPAHLPVAPLSALCRRHGAAVLVDGAHAVGAVALDIPAIGCDYYTSNLHKVGQEWMGWQHSQPGRWLTCAPLVRCSRRVGSWYTTGRGACQTCLSLPPHLVRLQWACTPKGAAFLWAARSRQRDLLPLVTSHGYGLVSLLGWLATPWRRVRTRAFLPASWEQDPSCHAACVCCSPHRAASSHLFLRPCAQLLWVARLSGALRRRPAGLPRRVPVERHL